MANTVTIRGFATTGIELRTTSTGLVAGEFRMGSNERHPDPITNVWADGHTNWFRVKVFRALAQNAVSSIHKGDRIIVVGKLKISTYFRKDGTTGTNVDIEAQSIGPDLLFGTAHYTRMASAHPAGQNYPRNDVDPSNVPPLHSGGADDVVPLNSGGGENGEHPGGHYFDQDDADGVNHEDDDQDADPENAEDPMDSDEAQELVGEGEILDKATGELLKEDVPF